MRLTSSAVRRIRGLVVVISAVAAATVFGPLGSASGQPGDANCAIADFGLSFNPGLRAPEQRPSTMTQSPSSTDWSNCSTPAAVSVKASGTTGQGSLGCVASSHITGSVTLQWSNFTSSTVNLTTMAMGVGSASKATVLEGNVVSGTFSGSKMTISWLSTANSSACATSQGLTHASGPATLTLTSNN